jgi:Ser/Thr protein kinase RdoA (MazF antagonist)
MDQQIINRFNDDILQIAIQRYGIPKGQVTPIDTFESFIYKFDRDGTGYILRISHSFRKSEALIQGEVDWINHLARGGVSVSRAVPSQNGRLVEVIDDGQGGQFLVTAFVEAAGQQPWVAGWSTTRYETYGELLGKMHALAVDYQPVPAWKRPEWDVDATNFIEQYLPASEVIAHREYKSLLEHIHSLPKDKSSYGLIHQDAHQNNFFMDESGAITLFDFDDCVYRPLLYLNGC